MAHITLIAALSRNGVIGRDNRLPWHIPDDLKRFKELTLGHPVIMGRKTWDSIVATLGKPLPGRANIVITRSPGFRAPGATVATTLEAALQAARQTPGASEVFIIGGAEIYRLALPIATRLALTEIDAEIEGTAFFPPFDPADWRETAREPRHSPPYRYDFVTYERP